VSGGKGNNSNLISPQTYAHSLNWVERGGFQRKLGEYSVCVLIKTGGEGNGYVGRRGDKSIYLFVLWWQANSKGEEGALLQIDIYEEGKG